MKNIKVKHIMEFNEGDKLNGEVIERIDRLPEYYGIWFINGNYKRYSSNSTF